MSLEIFDGICPEARELWDKIKPRLAEKEKEVRRIPVSILIWGPSPEGDSKISILRRDLRSILRQDGHLAVFSEEIYDDTSDITLRTQQLLQAEQFDIIISIPDSPGSIAEIHDFTGDTRINKKIVVFLNKQHCIGYSGQSLIAISNVLSCEIIFYENEDDREFIIITSRNIISQIREYKYLFGGRV